MTSLECTCGNKWRHSKWHNDITWKSPEFPFSSSEQWCWALKANDLWVGSLAVRLLALDRKCDSSLSDRTITTTITYRVWVEFELTPHDHQQPIGSARLRNKSSSWFWSMKSTLVSTCFAAFAVVQLVMHHSTWVDPSLPSCFQPECWYRSSMLSWPSTLSFTLRRCGSYSRSKPVCHFPSPSPGGIGPTPSSGINRDRMRPSPFPLVFPNPISVSMCCVVCTVAKKLEIVSRTNGKPVSISCWLVLSLSNTQRVFYDPQFQLSLFGSVHLTEMHSFHLGLSGSWFRLFIAITILNLHVL